MSRLRLPVNFEPSYTDSADNREFMRMEDEFADRLVQEEINKVNENQPYEVQDGK